MAATGIPVRLRKEPLLEAVWELRFQAANPEAETVLPGIFYGALAGEYGKIVRLPLMDLPAELVRSSPDFWYSPRIRLEGANKAIQVCHRGFTLNLLRPYPGWQDFSAQILRLLGLVRRAEVIGAPERFSIKYVNLLPATGASWLELLNMEWKMGWGNPADSAVQIRLQRSDGDLIHSCAVMAPVEVALPGLAVQKGTILETESIAAADPQDPWGSVEAKIEQLHDACKRSFISMLKAETIESFEPEYA